MLDILNKSSINIPTKYIILFWIIALILFTFYCIFRLWYLGAPAREMDKFVDTSINITTNPNVIQYADNLLAKDKITDVPDCANTFDDNYGVRALGYRSCNDAYADYIVKGLDTSNNYGATKSVADYCPVTTKSPQYMQCMATLLEKYNSGANMLQGVTNDMSALVNKRLQDRSNVLNDIQLEVIPYTNSKQIQDFELNTGLLGTANQTSDDKLYNASRYFQGKYGSSVSVFANVPSQSSHNATHNAIHNANNNNTMSNGIIEGFSSVSITVAPYIVSNFFGRYSSVKGQYLAFDNLQVSLDFMDNLSTTTTVPITTEESSNQGLGLGSGSGSEPSNAGKVSLTINDISTNGQIIYDIGNVDYYENVKNAIVLNITGQTTNVVNAGDDQNLRQLLVLLGISVPTKLVIMLEQTVSDAGVGRWTYKLMNLNMDTIMVLKKN
jgi:hypothetical protein